MVAQVYGLYRRRGHLNTVVGIGACVAQGEFRHSSSSFHSVLTVIDLLHGKKDCTIL